LCGWGDWKSLGDKAVIKYGTVQNSSLSAKRFREWALRMGKQNLGAETRASTIQGTNLLTRTDGDIYSYHNCPTFVKTTAIA